MPLSELAQLVPVELARNKASFALLGLLTHHLFHRYEWDYKAHRFLVIWPVALASIGAVEWVHSSAIKAALGTTATAAVVYFGTLVISILIHRVFFHRLRKFPGPFAARISKLHSVFAGVLPTKMRYFEYSEALHKKYKSDIIRTGPRELTVFTADAIPLVHGPLSKCTKGQWYDASSHLDAPSTQTTRDKQEHRRRRKLWDQAFSAKALREYEPRLNRHALALMTQLKEQAKKPFVRITDWFNFYSFDVMGDIGFNRSFGMVEKGEEDPMIKLLHASMQPLAIFNHLTWALALVTRTNTGAKPLVDHVEWTREVIKKRVKAVPAERDIVSWLLNPEKPEATSELNSEARLLVVAGSDTTSVTLSYLAYELCKNPAAQTKLREILDAVAPGKSHLDCDDVANIPYLDGAVNEALRLHPAVPSGVQRETPAEGLTLPDGTYIPGNVHIWMPMHTMQRDARYFASPLSFMPERWTDEAPGAVLDKRAFMPFSTGAYNCVGQKLAMMEIRTVIANVVRLFEMEFAEGEEGTVERESQDVFTTNAAKLDVKLTPRY